jgi:hypothetical protein
MRLGGWLWVLACHPRQQGDTPTDDGAPTLHETAEPPPTGDTGFGGPIAVSCQLQQPIIPASGFAPFDPPEGNALRFDCVVQVDPPQPVEIAFGKEDGTGRVRVHRSDLVAATHLVPLYLMAPQTDYTVIARTVADPSVSVTDTVTTGPLPLGAYAVIGSEGETTAPLLGMVSPCFDGANVVILNPHTNEVVWYQDFGFSAFGFVDAVSFTEDETVLVIADGVLSERDLAGNELNRWAPGGDLPYRFHHDAFRKDGRTYVLFSESVTLGELTYVLDGFYVFDELGVEIARWHLIDHFVPTSHNGSMFGDDYSHANAIWADDDQNVLISFRHLSALAQVVGDPASPEFGQITWRASGPVSDFGTDYTIRSEVGGAADFERQHNAYWLEDGRLTLFDNRDTWEEPSRLLEIRVDDVLKEMVIEAAYSLPVHCDFQGGAWRTPAGNPLATCAPIREGFEFDVLTGEQLWHGTASCVDGSGGYIPRFVPLSW